MSKSAYPADLMAAIADGQTTLSPKSRAIARYVISQPESFIRNRARDICAALGASEPTLIKFCQHYGYAGLSDFRIDLALAYAHQARNGRIEPRVQDRRRVNMDAKQAIARAAAGLVANDRSLLIDNGSTAELFAGALEHATPKTIMTTGLMVAQNALDWDQHTVMVTGGRIRPGSLALAGRSVETTLSTMRFDTFVMGADSVDPDLGLSTFLEEEAHNTRAMVDAAVRVIVLADRTKLMKPSLHIICGFDRVEALVTDLPVGDPAIARLEAQGVRVVLTHSIEEAA